MDFRTKLLIGIGGAGVTGGLGVAAYPYLSPKEEKKSILSVVTNRGKKFILSTSKSTHDTQWNAIKEEIKDNNVAKEEIGDPLDITKLKKWCLETSKRKSYDEDVLSKFEDRCTRNTILTEIKSKLTGGRAVIEFGNNEEWTNVHNNYKGHSSAIDEKLQITIGGTKITKEAMANKAAHDIRDWCNSMNNSLFISNEDDSYKTFEKWCVK